jgi:uncharacterized protein YdeI (YjbR/CyaY-like superfamily)
MSEAKRSRISSAVGTTKPRRSDLTAAGDLQAVQFASASDWRRWLWKHHADSPGVWLRFFKKKSGVASVTHAEALDEALCHGWIDGQLKPGDEESWAQRFTPRRSKSIWSKRNRERVDELIKTGRMTPAGLRAIESAKVDGRWDRAYDSPSRMKVPEDFLRELDRHPNAARFFAQLNKANLYAIAWRLQTAKKPTTRQKRMTAIMAMLAEGKKFH